ncbi:MAG TPA: hypothetical protein VFI47_11620, partial [Acidimicrobiales bacterium]|nr:hypothetical protein [Acidimicrobiales bacterium]
MSVGYAIGQSRRLGGGREVDKIDDLASRLAGLERGLHGVTGPPSATDHPASRPAPPPAADPGPVVLPVSPPLRPATAPPLPPVVRRGQIDKPYAVTHYAAL